MADVSQIKLPNGSVYDLIDEKSGYITAEYIENKTDYEIPVSRAGEIVAGETAIGTDSTNFPTSKAVVDYVDERVVQEIEAIDIPTVPTKTSDLTNDSGYLTASDIASVMTYKGTKANYAALPASGNTTGDVWHLTDTGAEWAWDGSAWQELGTVIAGSDYEILIDPSSQVGIAQTGTAITTESNYTPQGTVLLNKSKTQLISSAVLNASWDNYVLRLSIDTEIREIDTVDSAEFEGADVNLIIRQRSD